MAEYFMAGKFIHAYIHAYIQTAKQQCLGNQLFLKTRYLTNKSSCLDFTVCVLFPFVSVFHPLIPFLLCHKDDFLPVSPSAHFTIYLLSVFFSPPRSIVHYTSNLTLTPSTLPPVHPPSVQISVLEKLIFISFLCSVLSIIETVTCCPL